LPLCGFEFNFQIFFFLLLSLLLWTEIKIRQSLTQEKMVTSKKVGISSKFSLGWWDPLPTADTECDTLFLELAGFPDNFASEQLP